MNKKLMLGVTSLILVSNIWGMKDSFQERDSSVDYDLENGYSYHIIDIPSTITESKKPNRAECCNVLKSIGEMKNVLDNSIFQEFRDMGLDVPLEFTTEVDGFSSDEMEENKPSLNIVQTLMRVLFGAGYRKEKIE